MTIENDLNPRQLGELIKKLSEHLAVEVLAEATAEDYDDALVKHVADLGEAVVVMQALQIDVPYLVNEVIRLSMEHKSKN